MASPKRPCVYFQLGICKFGTACRFPHVVDPTFKRKACQNFMRGTCERGKDCTFSHEKDDIDRLRIANGAVGMDSRALQTSEARFRAFRSKIPTKAAAARPLGSALAEFFKEALDLVSGEIGTMQEVISLLADEGGLFRIDELLGQPSATLTTPQFTRVLNTMLIPFFNILTHDNVVSSVLLRARLITVYNIIYNGDGSGHRAISMFSTLAHRLSSPDLLRSNSENGHAPSAKALEAIETTIAVLFTLVEVNTPAHADADFLPIDESGATSTTPWNWASTTANSDNQLPTHGPHLAFQLEREIPGELSEQGRRHDNDSSNICDIQILPTLQEIQSSRNEYLPLADPQTWHLNGMQGLVDRHFRLLREDTVGQLRDIAKFELEVLQGIDAHFEPNWHRRRGARAFVYQDVYIASAGFDERRGIQVAIHFERPQGNDQDSEAARKEWWDHSKRLAPDALICLLSSEGGATFFVIAPTGNKLTLLQEEYDPVSDPEHAYIVAHPVTQSDIHTLLAQAFDDSDYVRLSLVEFPGVILPAFRSTLLALQQMSKNLDTPFSNILAPTSIPNNDLDREIEVRPPAYATKPGFIYDLASITARNVPLWFTPGDDIADVSAQLAQSSSLDSGQARAVISALAHSLAAIQGPPGTGKSYTGVHLIRALLANKTKTKIGPILVCTMTNHALDAILERALDDGVSQIVRIGGRSKSERMQEFNLQVLAFRLELTKTEKSQRWDNKHILESEAQQINKLLDAFASVGTESAIIAHLAEKYPAFYKQIFTKKDEDGFQIVKRSRRSALDLWLKGGRNRTWRPRPIAELRHLDSHEMNSVERRAILNSWLSEMREELHEKLRISLSSYNKAKHSQDIVRTELDLRVLKQADIIGVTTSGLARNLNLLREVGSKVLLCEEAGEVLEAHMLTALLPSVEHCILIGDHQQLRPRVVNFDLSTESHNGSQYALDVSLFERLVRPRDTSAQVLPFSTLEVQRRMHPSVSQLIRRTQYPNLQDDSRVALYPEVVGMRRRLFWMHHDQPEDESDDSVSTSHTNSYEVDMAAAIVKHVAHQGVYKRADIAVITPYLGQLRLLRDKFSSTHTILLNDRDSADLENGLDQPGAKASKTQADQSPGTSSKGTLNLALRLATVDNFQGEEAKVVIISLVRSNKEHKPGFLKTPNRINVLLSRAQHGMYILGNTKTMQVVPMWHDVIEILRNGGNLGDFLELCCPRHVDTPMFVQSTCDFARLSPEAGCDLLCEKQLLCGHACVAKCHSDLLHEAVYCLKPCTRLKKGCKHLCQKPCGDPCDPKCMSVIRGIRVTLDCGHVKTKLPCHEYQDPGTVVCKEPVKRTIPGCNHEIQVHCHVDVAKLDFECPATCGVSLPCGHICQSRCHDCNTRTGSRIIATNHGKCTRKCERGHNTCNHSCNAECHAGRPCPACTIKCETRCPHALCGKLCSEPCRPCSEERCSSGSLCPHSEDCQMPCAAPCTWIPCCKRCDKTLSCGCRCPSVCGEECPDVKFCQEHGSDDVKSMQADLVMFTAYKDVDLDEDPCIFTPCGHVFTMTSLDSTMGMQEHYDVDLRTGLYTGLKTPATPFSINDSKPCPECRGSLRKLARYGRIVRRALLDESAKKFTIWSNHRHAMLTSRLADVQGELMDSLDFPRKPSQSIWLEGEVAEQIKCINKLKTKKRYNEALALIKVVRQFSRKLGVDEQPYQLVHDLVEMARRQTTSSDRIAQFELNGEELQLREHLQAGNLLIRSYVVLISDVISVHNTTPPDQRWNLHVDLSANRVMCAEVATEAAMTKCVRQEAEAQMLWARLAAMECGVLENGNEVIDDVTQYRIDSLRGSADQRLKLADDACAQQAKAALEHQAAMILERPDLPVSEQFNSTQALINEVAEVRKMLNEGLSSLEMRMVVTAMAREFGGTGHWYRCVNSHPFAVGECGLPMELARCPECGATVGGQHHRATEGVTQARDIDARFGGLRV